MCKTSFFILFIIYLILYNNFERYIMNPKLMQPLDAEYIMKKKKSLKRQLLETVKSRKGSIFLLTIRYGRKRFKVKRNLDHTIYSFENCDDYLNCILALHKSSYPLSRNYSYIMDNKYYLCFSNSFISKKTKLLLCQYGEKCKNSILLARLKEYGKYIGENCVDNIGKNLTYKEP